MSKGRLLAGLVLVGAAATCATTGVALVPVQVTLGPCLMDYTSPSTYQPRASPLATVEGPVGSGAFRLCYGRPSARGREVYGGLVPWDSLWRFGANEPTRLYVDRPVNLAGIRLAPGRYSLYVRPGPREWRLFVSRSVLHWGNDISAGVRSREVGEALVPTVPLPQPVETLTVRRLTATNGGTVLAFDWAHTRVQLELRPQ